jgi:O-antigen/teichoic acid export membrane protein
MSYGVRGANGPSCVNLKNYAKWLRGGSWAVMDQGLFATSNFALSLLLARWFPPEYYGAFMVAYTLLWILGTFHAALLIQPMMVFGPGKYRDKLPEYFGALILGHVAYGLLVSVFLLLVALYMDLWGSRMLSSALLGLAFAGPLILFQWLMRQACYVILKPYLAALAGALYAVLISVGIYVLYRLDWLFSATAFSLMGLASLCSGFWLVICLRVRRPPLADRKLLRGIIMSHWRFGRWAAPQAVLSNVTLQLYSLLLPIWGGLAASGALRALWNLALPVIHTITALSSFLLPNLVGVRGRAEFKNHVHLALVLFTLGTGLYGLLLGLFHDPVIAWIYGGKYTEYSHLLWFVAFVPLVFAQIMVLSTALKALERPDLLFWSEALSTIVVLTLGLGLVATLEVTGAVIGTLAAQVTTAGTLAWLWVRRGSGWFSRIQEDHE